MFALRRQKARSTKQGSSHTQWPAFLRQTWVIEAVGVLAVIGAALVELAHMARADWLNIFLYDGDSLTLPLLQQSLARHEALLWVFSSQLNLFPEGLLYAAAAWGTSTVRAALAMSALINVLLFYVLLRALLRAFTTLACRQRELYAVLCTLILLSYMLLEVPSYPVIGQNYATYFLFTTYYVGSLLVGMFNLVVLAYVVRPDKPLRRNRLHWLLGSALIITSLTIASNPLYVVKFTLPFLATFAVLAAMRSLKLRYAAWLGGLQLVCVGLGMFIRLFLRAFIGESLGSHLTHFFSLQNWTSSFYNLLSMLAPYGASAGVRARILLSSFVYFGCLLSALFMLNRQQKKKGPPMAPHRQFLLVFIAINPIVVIVVLASGGDVLQRYFIAALILPLLGLIVLAGSKFEEKLRRHALALLGGLFVVFAIVGITTAGHLPKLTATTYPDEQCLSEGLEHRPANGVGSYSLARPLDVYNTDQERVLQAYGGLGVFPWLNNLAAYQNKSFSFVVIENDNDVETHNQRPTLDFTVSDLGRAAKTVPCPSFTLYVYEPGSPGYKTLNKNIQRSLQAALLARQRGEISTFNGFHRQLP